MQSPASVSVAVHRGPTLRAGGVRHGLLQAVPPRAAPAAPDQAGRHNRAPELPRQRPVFSFARTKIQPPRARAGALLVRASLQRRLVDAMLSRTLVLLQAAAGFGKTTALTQAIDALPSGTAVAWVACDEGDTPLQLFSCLVAALEPYDLPWRTAPDALLASALAGGDDPARQQKALRHMATELINALDAADVPHGVIAVDDLHRIDNPAVFRFLDLLCERFTPRWTLAIATRIEPLIALHRLRARGELADFQFHDLRFDELQAREIVSLAGLDAEAADALFARTEGWPAGLQLAVSVLGGAPSATLSGTATVIDRQMFDFLATEVLDRLDAGLREFLLSTSVLPELTAARCAALTGDRHAATHLETIERAGLFVTSLPEPEPTLRLHDLFRDALEHRLARERPQDLPGLLERAARSEPDDTRRLGYWIRGRHWDEAARELLRQTYELLTASQSAAVERWLAQFPEALQGSQPDLLTVRALLGWMHWRWADMVNAALAAESAYESAGRHLEAITARAYAVLALRGGGQRDHSESRAQRLEAEVDALLASRAGDMRAGRRWDGHEPGITAALLGRECVVWAAFDDARLDDLAAPTQRSIELLDHADGLGPLFQMLPLPAYVGLVGMKPALLRYVAKARARLPDDDAHLGTLVRALEGSVHLWAGDVARGEALLREAAAEVRWHDFPLRSTDHVYPFLCVADVLMGDTEALRRDAAALEHVLLRASELPDIGQRVQAELMFTGRWLLAGGCGDAALRLWRHIERWHDPRTRPLWNVQCSTLPAYVALAEGRLGDAEAGFSQAIAQHGRQLDLQGHLSELRLRTAALRLGAGRTGEAADVLRPLFDRHADDQDIAPVWLAGPTLLRDLAGAPWQGALTPAQASTLERWARDAAALRVRSAAQPPAAPRPAGALADAPPASPAAAALLSQRELEVLERIAAGDSNKLIARAFDLSPHTVKRHVANILDKLDLRSRGQAAAWFHEHGAAH